MFQDLVWALDLKRRVVGYDLGTGQGQVEYPLPFEGWDIETIQLREHYLYFVSRALTKQYTTVEQLARLDLLTGSVEMWTTPLESDMGSGTNGHHNTTFLPPDADAFLLFVAPELQQFSLADKRLVRS